MYVSAIRLEGLRCAPGLELRDLGRVVDLGHGPRGVAVADALTLFAASLDHQRMVGALGRLGIVGPIDEIGLVEEHGLPVQVSWPSHAGWLPLLDLGAERTFKITVDIQPDPPMFGDLRELAMRDARIVSALGNGLAIRIKVGWVFTNDLSVASIGLLEVRLGDASFPMSGSERPAWVPGLLRKIARRFARVGDAGGAVGQRLLDAALSSDPGQRSRYARAAKALARSPFRFGHLEVIREGDQVQLGFGDSLVRMRQFGPAALEAVELVDAVFLRAPDVLVVESPGARQLRPRLVRDWLGRCTRGDDATLEQVFLVHGGPG